MTEAPPEAEPPPTADAPPDPPPTRGSVVDAVRPADDRVVAGVCAGVARQLGIDPVVLRVAIGVLTLVGLSGLVLYAAAWVVLPDATTGRSVAQERLGVGEREPQVRGVVLVGGAALAVVSALGLVGDSPWDTPFPYLGLLALGALWWWVLRPSRRERRAARPVQAYPRTATGWDGATPVLPPPPRPVDPRHDGGRLTVATLMLALVAVGVVGVVSATGTPLDWSVYPAVALGVVALGMLLGTYVGNARPLVLPAVLVAGALAVASVLPSASFGERVLRPASASSLAGEYTLGVGSLRLDLTAVTDPATLAGRSVRLENGLGEVRVVVPRDLPVSVVARSRAGQVDVFDRRVDGGPNRLAVAAPAGVRHLELVVRQGAGQVEVTRR
ncbi:MAG: PspC domain-containing protein [Nocardioidaceae bacterium]|nr:PspC domain-containing protein [Nocardioidaceae bacterium]